MKNIKKTILFSLIIFIGLISVRQVMANTIYTNAEVAQHNTSNNCWTIYENGVYDITTYLNIHNQKYSNITSWCGTDMTTDFDSVRKHQGEATTLLASFKVGTIGASTTTTTQTPTATDTNSQAEASKDTTTTTTSNTTVIKNPYNLLLPLILGIVLYWGSLLIFKQYLKQFNAFWNTILLLTFLIPTFGFGIFMMLQYQFPSLMDIDFKFMYWHVELSVFMGVLAVSHFLRRAKVYFMQLKQK